MKVICIDNTLNKLKLKLTIGKEYEVLNNGVNDRGRGEYYEILNDRNDLWWYDIDKFISIKESRRKKLKKLNYEI